MWRRMAVLSAMVAGAGALAGDAGVGAAQWRSTVSGGETLPLDGVRVVVDQVTFIEQKCPPNARCIHSGIIKQVHFRILGSGAPTPAVVPQGATQIVDGVELKVLSVRAGPVADIEARRLP